MGGDRMKGMGVSGGEGRGEEGEVVSGGRGKDGGEGNRIEESGIDENVR